MGIATRKLYKHALLAVLFIVLFSLFAGCTETTADYDVSPGYPVDITVQTVEDYDIEVVINTDLHEDSVLDNIRFPDGATNTGTISWLVENQKLVEGENVYAFQVAYTNGTVGIYSVELTVSGHNASTEESIILKEPTCDEDGVQYYHCTLCDNDYDTQSIYALGHDYSDFEHTMGTCVSYGYTYHACTVCGEYETDEDGEIVVVYDEELEPHSYDKVRITLEPTCQSTGKATTTCSVCGDTTSDSLSKTSCIYSEELLASGTCLTPELYQLVCGFCGSTSGDPYYGTEYGDHAFVTTCCAYGCGEYVWNHLSLFTPTDSSFDKDSATDDELMIEYAKENAVYSGEIGKASLGNLATWYLIPDGFYSYTLMFVSSDEESLVDLSAYKALSTSEADMTSAYGWYTITSNNVEITSVYISDTITSVPSGICAGTVGINEVYWSKNMSETDLT
ncbi:MAG: hypothetical protein R3Y32_02420 [Bacillota bacterium]